MHAVNAAHNTKRPTENIQGMAWLSAIPFDGAWSKWKTRHPAPDGQPEDLGPAAERVASMCSDAHDLMHSIAKDRGCSDNPRAAAFDLATRTKEPQP
jgi:hypothetical protein